MKPTNLGGDDRATEHTDLYQQGYSHSCGQHVAHGHFAKLLSFWQSLF
jgi:hypothetical protein